MACISVIIPTWNRPNLISDSINSAIAAGRDVEVVVVDSGKSEATAEICRKNANVRYLRLETNEGPSAARNVGVKNTPAEYVAFLDDDDILLPGSLDKLRCALDAAPMAGVAYGPILLGDADCKSTGVAFPSELFEGNVFWRLLERNFLLIHGGLVRRTALQHVGLFDRTLSRNEDWDLWLRLAADFPFVAVDEVIGVVRTGDTASPRISQDWGAMSAAALDLHERWMQLPRARQGTARQRKNVRDAFLRDQAWALASAAITAVKRRDYRVAMTRFGHAVRLRPIVALRRIVYAAANIFRNKGQGESRFSNRL